MATTINIFQKQNSTFGPIHITNQPGSDKNGFVKKHGSLTALSIGEMQKMFLSVVDSNGGEISTRNHKNNLFVSAKDIAAVGRGLKDLEDCYIIIPKNIDPITESLDVYFDSPRQLDYCIGYR